MKIKTDQFGEIEFAEKNIINFKNGILGFENLKKYLFISEDEGIFFWLASVEEPGIIFPLFAINVIQDDFKNIEDYEPYGIVKFDKDPADITVNLKSPVYINQNINKGFQKILDREDYPVDYQLFIKQ